MWSFVWQNQKCNYHSWLQVEALRGCVDAVLQPSYTALSNVEYVTLLRVAIRHIPSVIPRLHDQANIEQTSSKCIQNTLHDIRSNYLMFASCRLCFMHSSYLLDVCSMFAWWLLDRV